MFALLPCTENYPSSDKLISLLGWVAVPTDSWFPARALLAAVQGNGQQGFKNGVERVQARAPLGPVGTEAPREVQVRAFGPVGTESLIFFSSGEQNPPDKTSSPVAKAQERIKSWAVRPRQAESCQKTQAAAKCRYVNKKSPGRKAQAESNLFRFVLFFFTTTNNANNISCCRRGRSFGFRALP